MSRMAQSSLVDRLSSQSFWNAEKAIIFRKLESASGTNQNRLREGQLMPGSSRRNKTTRQRRWFRQKSKGADLPQSRRLTLQSQFSQGESMNEEILKSSRAARVAEILQSTCELLI